MFAVHLLLGVHRLLPVHADLDRQPARGDRRSSPCACRSPWRPVSIVLIITHFFIPFLTLLSRKLKRNPRHLRIMGLWLLAVNFLDLYWLIMPTLSPDEGHLPRSG
jgi:hypothetical protein